MAGIDPAALLATRDVQADAAAARRQVVKERTEAGDSLGTVATSLGVSVEMVRADVRAIRKRGEGRPLAGTRGGAARRAAEITKLMADGLSVLGIASRTGLKVGTVRRYTRAARETLAGKGVTVSPNAKAIGIANDRRAVALSLHNRGMNRTQIATELGVSVGSVCGYLRGLPLNHRRPRQRDAG